MMKARDSLTKNGKGGGVSADFMAYANMNLLCACILLTSACNSFAFCALDMRHAHAKTTDWTLLVQNVKTQGYRADGADPHIPHRL